MGGSKHGKLKTRGSGGPSSTSRVPWDGRPSHRSLVVLASAQGCWAATVHDKVTSNPQTLNLQGTSPVPSSAPATPTPSPLHPPSPFRRSPRPSSFPPHVLGALPRYPAPWASADVAVDVGKPRLTSARSDLGARILPRSALDVAALALGCRPVCCVVG